MLVNLLKRSRVAARLRAAWRHDVEQDTKPLRHDIVRLQREVERLSALVSATAERAARADQIAAQAKYVLEASDRDRQRLGRLDAVLDEDRIGAHVRDAIARASLCCDPYEHIVVEHLLPEDVYQLLLETLPPVAFFGQRDPIRQDLPLPLEFGPPLSMRAWNFMEEVIAQRVIRTAVIDKFHAPLQAHFDAIFGLEFRDRANALPNAASGGRLMLRRPGYHLSPHRDPKRSLVTCLFYLARDGDSDTYGTQIFRVHDDGEAGYKQTYYPEAEGKRCELVRAVPFRPNTMLAFVNSRGAHGASIPADAPETLERYSYQFYVAPRSDMLSELIKDLPPAKRAMWRNKAKVVPAEGGREVEGG
jgi:hypothetical protein